MKVKELRDILAGLPDDMEIILSKDSEGNSFSPLADYNDGSIYVPETTWYGHIYDDCWTARDADMEESEWIALLARPRSLVLWPTN